MLDLQQMQAKFKAGSRGGQCVIFCRFFLPDLPYGLLSKWSKKIILSNSKGFIPKKGYDPQIGDMIVTDEGKWGHVAIINEVINPKTLRVRLSESNYNLDEKVTHDRIISLSHYKNKFAYAWRSNVVHKIDHNLKNQLIFIERRLKKLYDYCNDNNSGQEYLDFAHKCADDARALM